MSNKKITSSHFNIYQGFIKVKTMHNKKITSSHFHIVLKKHFYNNVIEKSQYKKIHKKSEIFELSPLNNY